MKKLIVFLSFCICIIVPAASYGASAWIQSNYPGLFEEVAEIVEGNFYNPTQIARDFPAIKETYRNQLKQVSTQEAFSSLVNAMLRELNASHTYYLTPDDYEYYHLGALFSKIT